MLFKKIKISSDLHVKEEIYLVLRRHWIIPLAKGLFWILLLAILSASEVVLRTNFDYFSEPLPKSGLGLVRITLLMTVALGLFMTWVMYYLNVQVITNERIIDINQKSLLHHQSSELNMDRLQDVTTEIKGPVANFFNFGNVFIQTAGETQNFVFNHIPNPHHVSKIILELYERIRTQQNSQASLNND